MALEDETQIPNTKCGYSGYIAVTSPICSMGLEYLPTFTGEIHGGINLWYSLPIPPPKINMSPEKGIFSKELSSFHHQCSIDMFVFRRSNSQSTNLDFPEIVEIPDMFTGYVTLPETNRHST